MTRRISFGDGKYSVENENGHLTWFRHNVPWEPDLPEHSNVVLALVQELERPLALGPTRAVVRDVLARVVAMQPAVGEDGLWIKRGEVVDLLTAALEKLS